MLGEFIMLKRIRHFFGIYTKEEKFFNGYNTMIWAIKNKDWILMQNLYHSANVNNSDIFSKGVIRAYNDYHSSGVTTKGE